MVFEIDNNSKKIIASIQKDNEAEKYECSLLACDNPVCTCEDITLNLSPLWDENKEHFQLLSHSIDINVIKNFPFFLKVDTFLRVCII